MPTQTGTAMPPDSLPSSASHTSKSPAVITVPEPTSDFRFLVTPRLANTDEYDSYSSSDEEEHGDLEGRGVAKWLQELNIDGPGGYQGKSSNIHLVKDAIRVRSHSLDVDQSTYAAAEMMSFHKNRRPEVWATFPVGDVPLSHVVILTFLPSGRHRGLSEIISQERIPLHFLSGIFCIASSTTISSTSTLSFLSSTNTCSGAS
jgi:hypothetical protein